MKLYRYQCKKSYDLCHFSRRINFVKVTNRVVENGSLNITYTYYFGKDATKSYINT